MSADPFEAARPRIRGLAYRMLGTFADADDVAQDTWLRWQAVDAAHIANAEAWLVTAATRLCLDRLRSASRAREVYPGPWLPEPIVTDPGPAAAADRVLVNGLLRALASGEVNEVVARLAPDVVCITDGGPKRRAARRPVTGSSRVARFLISAARRYRYLASRPAEVGGSAGAILSAGDTVEQVMAVTSKEGVITSVYFIGNPDKLTSVGHPPCIQ